MLNTIYERKSVRKYTDQKIDAETIVPHSLIAFGYPDDEVSSNKEKNIWEENRVHYNKW